MKKGILSILIAIIGFYCIYRFHIQLYHEKLVLSQAITSSDTISSIDVFRKTYKIIIISIGLLSLYLGIISFLKKNKISVLGILLALILILSGFFPFLENSIVTYLYDINIQ